MSIKKIISGLLKMMCYLSFVICAPVIFIIILGYTGMYYESFKDSPNFGIGHFLKCAFNNCYDNISLEDFDGFRFIDYQTSDNAESALLKLHPIGSETKALTERFKRLSLVKSKPTDDMNCKTALSAQHREQPVRPFSLIARDWNIFICDNDGRIQSIKLQLTLTGL